MAFKHRTALIIGGSRGAGRALSLDLSKADVRTIAIARNQDNLDDLKVAAPAIETMALDAAENGVASRLIADTSPDLIILAGGHVPQMHSISQFTWQDFSASWNTDTKISFEFTKAAILAPIPRGSTIVSISSGAAIAGSPLSGGYAGAKRMQHFISNYGQWESDRHDLGLNFYTVYPKQFIAGTDIANAASKAYADAKSVSQEQIMNQWDKPLTPELMSTYVLALLSDTDTHKSGAYGMTGTDMEFMD